MENEDFTVWKCCVRDDSTTTFSGDNVEERAKEHLRKVLKGQGRDGTDFSEDAIHRFYVNGTPEYRERGQGRTHGTIEKYMSTRFNVLHVHRDHRGDCCDDAGWIAVISEKDEKYLLHVFFITYNRNLHDIVFDEEELVTNFSDDKGAFSDCKVFDTLEDVQVEINKFMDYVEKALVGKDEDWYDLWDDEDMEFIEERLGVKFTPLDQDWMMALTNPYEHDEDEYDWHFVEDKKAMLNLTKSEYLPNFED